MNWKFGGRICLGIWSEQAVFGTRQGDHVAHPAVEGLQESFDKKKEKGKGTMVCICEGQSAAGSITSCRDVNNQAVFVLKGKPLNVWDLKRDVMYMDSLVVPVEE